MLKIIDKLPDGLLDAVPESLYTLLGGPTLLHLPGRRPEPLFVSILQHGNEYTGVLAAQALLRKYRDRSLPRALSLFIGNIEAARYSLRRLDHQPDYNRVWSGDGTREHRMMQQIVADMRRRRAFASVDIHNNTGKNPHYACVNRLENPFLHLASLFSRTVVYFIRPDGVQSKAFAEFCPAVTLECGQPGEPHGTDHAVEFLDACLHLAEIPNHAVPTQDIGLFHTTAIVKIPEGTTFGFGTTATDIQFEPDLDRLNFSELPVNTFFARINTDNDVSLDVTDETGVDVCGRYFTFRNKEIRSKIVMTPSMLSINAQVVRQDCLCYLMERLPVPQ